jgi:ribosome assembly protein YihI (activator of Der GTPase)
MATRKKKDPAAGAAKKLTRGDLKQKIRDLKKQRKEAGTHSAKAKVNEYNEQLRVWRRKLSKVARKKA